MARAEVASASVNSDSIKGLAQSIAKPAYRRLLTAEPALRRAVPALIIAFLLTICVGAIVQVLEHRRQAIAEIVRQIEGSADFLVDRIERLERANGVPRRLQSELERMIPAWARAAGREVLVTDGEGVIVAGVRHEVVSLAYGTVRSLFGSNGELAIVHGRAQALAPWLSDTALTVTLSATTGFVVLILGFAFHWQATRAREADLI